MKKISAITILFFELLFCFVLIQKINAQTYDALNISLLGHFDDTSYVANNWVNSKYAGCWGWFNPADKKEYAIIGGSKGIYYIEITDPKAPVLRDYLPGINPNCVWREIKTYQHYSYMVSDDVVPNGLQIADLSYLPDSVHIVHSSNSIIERCHTIFIDGNKLYGGLVRGGVAGPGSSMAVYSLANPEAPSLLRTLNDDDPTIGLVHDMFVRNDTVYASCGNQGLYIYKFNPSNTFSTLSYLNAYPYQGYNHSGGLTADGKTFIFMDEVPQHLPIKSLDISDLANPVVVANFKSSEGDTPHNPFVIGNDYVVCCNYQDGIQIYKISDPAHPVRTGYFDTHWQTTISDSSWGYTGCWGAYPYLPSGNMIVTDMQNGMYILNAAAALGIPQNAPVGQNSANIYYSGNDNSFEMQITSATRQKMNLELFDVLGQLIYSSGENLDPGVASKSINAAGFAKGIYIFSLKGDDFNYTKKIFKPE
ncbi:MAG: choice-of-anchor B family protein [Bacteroidia bacterium]